VSASPAGRVELDGTRALHVLWSLRPAGLGGGVDYGYATPRRGETVSLSVDGARTTIRRLRVAPSVRARPVRRPVFGEYFAPAGTGARRPGILVFGGSEGGLSGTGLAALFASHGYPSLAVAYFGAPGLPHDLVRIDLGYFARALRWLARQPGVDPGKLAVEGISRGSEAAQLLGIHYPRLVHAVIAMVPSDDSKCGITRFTGTGYVRCIGPAWTLRGRAIPYGAAAAPFADERIDGPIFLDCGGLDRLWPSCPMADAIVSRLHAHRFRHAVVFLDYPHAGHGVGSLYPNVAGYSDLLGGAFVDSNDRAAADGWPRLLRFLRGFAGS
jgi:dienelactone hydrolase